MDTAAEKTPAFDTKSIEQTFRVRLKTLMQKNNYTAEKLAQKICDEGYKADPTSVKISIYSWLKNGSDNRLPSIKYLLYLSKIFSISVEQLLGAENIVFPSKDEAAPEGSRRFARLDKTNAVILKAEDQSYDMPDFLRLYCPECNKIFSANLDCTLLSATECQRHYRCNYCGAEFDTIELGVPAGMTIDELYNRVQKGVPKKATRKDP